VLSLKELQAQVAHQGEELRCLLSVIELRDQSQGEVTFQLQMAQQDRMDQM